MNEQTTGVGQERESAGGKARQVALWVFFALLLGAIIGLHWAWWHWSEWYLANIDQKYAVGGQIGDRFGFLTSLLSGLAFWGLIVTLFMQRHELIEQRETLQAQLDQLKLQREDLELQREVMRESRVELAKSSEAQERLARLQRDQNDLAATEQLWKMLENMRIFDYKARELIGSFSGSKKAEAIQLRARLVQQHAAAYEVWKGLMTAVSKRQFDCLKSREDDRQFEDSLRGVIDVYELLRDDYRV